MPFSEVQLKLGADDTARSRGTGLLCPERCFPIVSPTLLHGGYADIAGSTDRFSHQFPGFTVERFQSVNEEEAITFNAFLQINQPDELHKQSLHLHSS